MPREPAVHQDQCRRLVEPDALHVERRKAQDGREQRQRDHDPHGTRGMELADSAEGLPRAGPEPPARATPPGAPLWGSVPMPTLTIISGGGRCRAPEIATPWARAG